MGKSRPFSNLAGAAGIALAILLAAPNMARAAEPERLGIFSHWISYSLVQEDGHKVCYAVSEPTEKLPKNVDHGNVFFLVTLWPAKGNATEPSLMTGYDFKEGSTVTAEIGGDKWNMFTYQKGAWVREAKDEKNLVDAMRRGSSMRVKGTSSRGTATEYTISLSGISAALDKIASSCE